MARARCRIARLKKAKTERDAVKLLDEAKYRVVAIADLVPAAWNYKEDDADLTEKLKENLKRNGQVENIIVRELQSGQYEVVNGNHRYYAMKEIGAKKIFCFNLGAFDDAEAYRVAIETNETRFRTDNLRLSVLMKKLLDASPIDDLVRSLPYTTDQIMTLAALKDFSWDEAEAGDTAGAEADDTGGGGEPFDTLHLSLPRSLADLLREQLERLRVVVAEARGVAISDVVGDVAPVEAVVAVVAGATDDALADAVAGLGG